MHSSNLPFPSWAQPSPATLRSGPCATRPEPRSCPRFLFPTSILQKYWTVDHAERLADLFQTNKGDVLKVLGVSRSKVSRNPAMNVEILDRAGHALKLYARIAAMVGPESAARWLNKINEHLGGKRPIDLLSTHLGGERVEDLVTALEDGTF